jgi:hypothetical protein
MEASKGAIFFGTESGGTRRGSEITQIDRWKSHAKIEFMNMNSLVLGVVFGSLSVLSGLSMAMAEDGGIKLTCSSSTTLKKFSSSDNSITYSCEKKVTKKKYKEADLADYKYAYKQCDDGYTIDAEDKAQDECNAKRGADAVAKCALGDWRFAVSKEGSPAGNGYDRCYQSCPIGRGYFKMSLTDSSDVRDVTSGDTVNLNKYKIVCGDGEDKVTVHTQPSQSDVVIVDD